MTLFDTELIPFESETEERKETWEEECMKSLAAFANTKGGCLWLGVKDNGTVIGWNGNGKDQETISSKIVDVLHVHPASMGIEIKDNKPVLIIHMHKAAAPVALRGRYYRRVGNSSRELPAEELPRFLLERTGQTWDALPCDFSIDAVKRNALDDFRVLSRERLPAMAPSDSGEIILNKLKLITPDKRLKRAAFLLFGDEPQRLAPTAQIQVGRFKDDETILDDKRLTGNLFEQLEQVEKTLRQYFFVRYEFPTGQDNRSGIEALQRGELWEFPYKAVREAVLNALIHRDYTSTGRIQIRVYDDRMIITNPGGLPLGLKVSDLLQEPHDSLPRNPILAEVCYYAKLVEQWGSGTIRMRNSCRAQGLPDPLFLSTPTSFTVTLRKDELSDERLRQIGMNARQIRAVHFVRQNGSISNSEHQQLTNTPRRTAARDLELLAEAGLFVRMAKAGRSVRFQLAARSNANVPNVPNNVP